jgi:hypothetical protein
MHLKRSSIKLETTTEENWKSFDRASIKFQNTAKCLTLDVKKEKHYIMDVTGKIKE